MSAEFDSGLRRVLSEFPRLVHAGIQDPDLSKFNNKEHN
jgi:hypothetical protein